MAEGKNETGKSSMADKKPGADTSGKVSAGTSVGNIGEAPMPHAQTGGASAQAGKPSGGQAAQQHAQGQSQGGSTAGKAEQARQKAGKAYEGASEWAQDTYERASEWASGGYDRQRRRMGRMGGRSRETFGHARDGVQSYVAENPMVVGLVGLATGLLLGALLPRTRREDEMFGEWADEVRNQGMRYAREATHMGREYLEESLGGEDAGLSGREGEQRPNQPDANRH